MQFNRGFTFDDARAIVPYLARLGVDTLYASPVFAASPGSMHGYDVIDFNRLNPEIGDETSFRQLVAALHEHDLGLILDFVPNHMGIAGGANGWWQDVLEHGPASEYADWFDIDWRPVKTELRGKVLLPVLGDVYGAVLERGELQLRYDDGEFAVTYYETRLPLEPGSYALILEAAEPAVIEQLGEDDLGTLRFQSIRAAFARLPRPDETDPDLLAERRREHLVGKRRLAELAADTPVVGGAIAAAVKRLNGDPENPASFDALDRLLDAQCYRLASFRTAAEQINYRRFFAINELAAIRQENPAVFAATHALLLRLIDEGLVDGARIDHPDGLWDPAAYFRDLQAAVEHGLPAPVGNEPPDSEDGEPAADPESWSPEALPLYLVVEKIIEGDERLPASWPVHGTVGYEFARSVAGLFVDSANRARFDELYQRFTGDDREFADLVYDKKRMMLHNALASELNVLTRALDRISERDRHSRDFTFGNLHDVLEAIIASFPIYRTYVDCADGTVSEADRRVIESAVRAAQKRNPAIDAAVFDFARDVLLLHQPPAPGDPAWDARCRFVMKFQQLTGPVMAKGVEDTVFYLYNRLTSLNEVGGAPDQFGAPVDAFHRDNQERAARWPHMILASSTHDTKRAEDTRARISVLSEMPRDWRAAINRWTRLNRKARTRLGGRMAPHRADEYFFYQNLLGIWPAGATSAEPDLIDRIDAYLLKAIREGQERSSWINPDTEYETALSGFIRTVLKPGPENPFVADFAAFHDTIARLGAINSVVAQVLKLTVPGVPDLYQGTEVFDFSLVDPDNRRPVDFAQREALLSGFAKSDPSAAAIRDLTDAIEDGRLKLRLTSALLHVRRDHPDLFAAGDYRPLAVSGKQADQVVAFARRHGDDELVIVAPRLVGKLTGNGKTALTDPAVWGATRVELPDTPNGDWRDLLTGETVVADKSAATVADLLQSAPVAVLIRTATERPD